MADEEKKENISLYNKDFNANEIVRKITLGNEFHAEPKKIIEFMAINREDFFEKMPLGMKMVVFFLSLTAIGYLSTIASPYLFGGEIALTGGKAVALKIFLLAVNLAMIFSIAKRLRLARFFLVVVLAILALVDIINYIAVYLNSERIFESLPRLIPGIENFMKNSHDSYLIALSSYMVFVAFSAFFGLMSMGYILRRRDFFEN